MDTSRIVKEQRDMILKKYGFDIKVEEAQLSAYKYTINYGFNGGFTATIYRDKKDELDSLLQLILYMDSVPYKIALTEANAYWDCFKVCSTPFCANSGFWSTQKVVDYIKTKYNNAKKLDAEKELPELGIKTISSLHCNNILGLENSRKKLPELYTELKWLKEASDHKQVDYESLIPVEENSQSEI